MATLIIIPTYNERENIEKLLPDIYRALPGTHVLIVDDNSPDQTATFIENLQKTQYTDTLHLLKRAGKLGLGTAYIAGFQWALQRDYDYIFEMDADFSHQPEYLPKLLEKAQAGDDLVLGSRYVQGGGVRNWSLPRRLISRGGSLYAKTLLGLPLNDLTGGFKCFRRSTLEKLPLDQIECAGYAFQIELTYRTHLLGMKVAEVPIIFIDRTVGQSKMSKKIFLEAVLMVLKMRWQRKRFKRLLHNFSSR